MAKASEKVIDFSGVRDSSGISPRHVAEGDYLAVIERCEDAKTKESGEFQYLFVLKLVKFSQNKYPYYCKLQENQLWKLRNLLVAAGMNVPKKRLKLDPSRVVGKQVGVTMEDDTYDGKLKSVISAVFPPSELGEGVYEPDDQASEEEETGPVLADSDDSAEEAAEEKPKKKGKKKKGKKSEAEELDLEDL
jgi:hypothetical protein